MLKSNLAILSWCIVIFSCSKKSNPNQSGTNHSPVAIIAGELIKTNPFTYRFIVTAADQDQDRLTYSWDFGEGTTRNGKAEEVFDYPAEMDFVVKVKVSDGKSEPVDLTITVSTKIVNVSIDLSKKYQTMEGFGGFGALKEYWAQQPFTNDDFINAMINDLGLTILRDNLTTSFEPVNDNNDPYVTDLSKFNINSRIEGLDEPLFDHLEYLKKMKAAGLQKLIVSIWSPAVWMKYNNKVGNGTQNQNSAPAYTTNPTGTTNQLKPDMYNEFAEMCVAYIRIIKLETGLDVYALGIQNEPRFSQFYSSAVYDGNALRDVLKVVGKRLREEGLNTKLMLPEDVGWLQGVESMTKPTLNDADARQYADIIAVHGYDLDGVTPASTSAQTWQTMYSWGAPFNKPLWMTETSGFENNFAGAMKLAKAMYTALKYGNVSAWLHWSLSTTTLDSYSLMSSSGEKSKRYYVSKSFYRFIRPGAVRVEATVGDGSNVYPLAFHLPSDNATTIVLINDAGSGKPVKLSGAGLPLQFTKYVTSSFEDTKDNGVANSSDVILLPASSVMTLYKKN